MGLRYMIEGVGGALGWLSRLCRAFWLFRRLCRSIGLLGPKMRLQPQLCIVSYAQNDYLGELKHTWNVCEGSLLDGEAIYAYEVKVSLLKSNT
jgi:hypothetical protein